MRIFSLSIVLSLVATLVAANPNALAAVNAERASQGRAALTYDARLEAAAKAHARDMARKGFMSHTGSDGSNLGTRIKRTGFRYCFGAENIAMGQNSLDGAMASWMNSGGHRKNILNRKAKSMGFAQASGNRWVLVLGAEC